MSPLKVWRKNSLCPSLWALRCLSCLWAIWCGAILSRHPLTLSCSSQYFTGWLTWYCHIGGGALEGFLNRIRRYKYHVDRKTEFGSHRFIGCKLRIGPVWKTKTLRDDTHAASSTSGNTI